MKICGDAEADKRKILLLSKGVLRGVYQKVSEGEVPHPRKDFPRGQNKMDRNLVISASSDGSGVGETSLALVESSVPAAVPSPQEQMILYDPRCDPRVLIQSQTTEWVMRRVFDGSCNMGRNCVRSQEGMYWYGGGG